MYFEQYGLRQNPFIMSPDPRLLYMTVQHREALAGLLYAVLQSKGMAVLTGDAGTGKTTLLRRTLCTLPEDRIPASIIFNPALTAPELLEMTMIGFGMKDIPPTKPQRLRRMQEFLLAAHERGKVPLLAIDEAHVLSRDLLEEIRLLSNFELANVKLLQIVLLGQNELNAVLNQENLRQFRQRIAVRLSIHALDMTDTEQYIRFRWRECGGAATLPFTPEALVVISALSRGIPRVINALCDNAIMVAFGQGLKTVTEQHVKEAATDLQLEGACAPLVAEAKAAETALPLTSAIPRVRIGNVAEEGSQRRSMLWRWASRFGFAN